MEKSKKIKVLDVLLVIITLTGVFILLYIFFMLKNLDKPYNVVLPAISRAHAEGMVKENECYIVRLKDPERMREKGGWYYMDGRKKISMRLGGRNPALELSDIFQDPDRNTFLVKGRIDEEWTQRNGCLTFNVESWYLIAPIKRDYGPRYYRDEQRWFYPEDYLDLYDLEQGDYTPFED